MITSFQKLALFYVWQQRLRQEIQKLFEKSDKGKIHEIHRIQSRALWDNYITEKNKLIQMYQNQVIKLTNQEESRYLWHGVRNYHPSVIYSGLKEAFDQSFSQVGSWGAGIYFAENANYSRGYSYKLFQNYNRNRNGKLVFLCCLVTTGKVERQNQSKNIKRPSDGYDCVSSIDINFSFFILWILEELTQLMSCIWMIIKNFIYFSEKTINIFINNKVISKFYQLLKFLLLVQLFSKTMNYKVQK